MRSSTAQQCQCRTGPPNVHEVGLATGSCTTISIVLFKNRTTLPLPYLSSLSVILRHVMLAGRDKCRA